MDKLVKKVGSLLAEAGDEATRRGAERFFKEDQQTRFHGVKSAEVRKIAKQTLSELKGEDKETVFALCGELMRSGYQEEHGVACEWAYAQRKRYVPADMAVFEGWIDHHVGNWTSCDTLCNHSVGTLVEMYPELASRLIAWTGDDNRWKKRAAAVTLIIPARKGLFLKEIFIIADKLLGSGDDMVRKGYGWMLKAAGEAYPREVFDFVVARKATMPRTAYRYALEKLPKELREEAMRKG